FFQAEDGIRGLIVTGVQTCALPISGHRARSVSSPRRGDTASSMAWLTVQEAADLLRVPVSWLYERTRTNSVPHVKLGKYLRFDQIGRASCRERVKNLEGSRD